MCSESSAFSVRKFDTNIPISDQFDKRKTNINRFLNDKFDFQLLFFDQTCFKRDISAPYFKQNWLEIFRLISNQQNRNFRCELHLTLALQYLWINIQFFSFKPSSLLLFHTTLCNGKRLLLKPFEFHIRIPRKMYQFFAADAKVGMQHKKHTLRCK